MRHYSPLLMDLTRNMTLELSIPLQLPTAVMGLILVLRLQAAGHEIAPAEIAMAQDAPPVAPGRDGNPDPPIDHGQGHGARIQARVDPANILPNGRLRNRR